MAIRTKQLLIGTEEDLKQHYLFVNDYSLDNLDKITKIQKALGVEKIGTTFDLESIQNQIQKIVNSNTPKFGSIVYFDITRPTKQGDLQLEMVTEFVWIKEDE